MNSRRNMLRHVAFMAFMAWHFTMPCLAASDDDHVVDMKIDDAGKVISVYMDDAFADQQFTEKSVKKINKKITKGVRKALPSQYRKYTVKVIVRDTPIENLIPGNELPKVDPPKHHKKKRGGWWGDLAYDGLQWVRNLSRPVQPKAALSGKHLSLWASHGRYYDLRSSSWQWQRPYMFCTNEDLFTQTFVVPFLIPMLESAGANVFTPRERDWQTEEVVIDDDPSLPSYTETSHTGYWKEADIPGFAIPQGVLVDSMQPFAAGKVHKIAASKDPKASIAIYKPQIRKTGRYAVYVSYATVENSIDEVIYSVYHQGQRTDFAVNQKMGGGTWVYLGTFEFDKGFSAGNCVTVSSYSHKKGVVTTDAVRFGGGMGNVERGGVVSGLPRCLEGSRCYAQWAGVPYSVYAPYKGEDDYKDDYTSRPRITNWLGGGSPYMPGKEGKKVPIDLSLGLHSDAGFNKDMETVFGSLAICTTDFNDRKLDAGVSRDYSRRLCDMIKDQTVKDMADNNIPWTFRDVWDKNYAESRIPGVPSAIFEMLSHQSFPDMRLAHDPNFKFLLARSIYKTILNFEAEAHGEQAVVQPLAPEAFKITLNNQGYATLVWTPQNDDHEPTARPTSYNIYKASGNMGYDNGFNTSRTYATFKLTKDVPYRFRVTAVNDGGESFPTEELFVLWHDSIAPTVLVLNGFNRLAAPAVRAGYNELGFDMDEDPGLSYGLTAGWTGRQLVFDTATAGKEGRGTFSYSGNEMSGHFVAGNTFDYVTEHAMAIASARRFNIVSATRGAVEWGGLKLSGYDAVDLVLGNERYDGYSLKTYKTFTKGLQRELQAYSRQRRGALLVSGSYIATDMGADDEVAFLKEVCHLGLGGTVREVNGTVTGLQQTIKVVNTVNPEHYASVQSDVLQPEGKAFAAMQYGDQQTAAVAYKGNVSTFAVGFPLECMADKKQLATVMRGIMTFLVP